MLRCKILVRLTPKFLRTIMSTTPEEIVIVGVTESGKPFRPSDWAERLCGCMSVFGENQRIAYSPMLKPVLVEGVKCVVIDCRLEEINPIAFSFLMSFARDNELRLRKGRQAPRMAEPRFVLETKSPQS